MIKKVKCPTFIIHGKKDRLIPYIHSIELLNNCGGIVDMNLPEQMTHNDFNVALDIGIPIVKFLKKLKI